MDSQSVLKGKRSIRYLSHWIGMQSFFVVLLRRCGEYMLNFNGEH